MEQIKKLIISRLQLQQDLQQKVQDILKSEKIYHDQIKTVLNEIIRSKKQETFRIVKENGLLDHFLNSQRLSKEDRMQFEKISYEIMKFIAPKLKHQLKEDGRMIAITELYLKFYFLLENNQKAEEIQRLIHNNVCNKFQFMSMLFNSLIDLTRKQFEEFIKIQANLLQKQLITGDQMINNFNSPNIDLKTIDKNFQPKIPTKHNTNQNKNSNQQEKNLNSPTNNNQNPQKIINLYQTFDRNANLRQQIGRIKKEKSTSLYTKPAFNSTQRILSRKNSQQDLNNNSKYLQIQSQQTIQSQQSLADEDYHENFQNTHFHSRHNSNLSNNDEQQKILLLVEGDKIKNNNNKKFNNTLSSNPFLQNKKDIYSSYYQLNNNNISNNNNNENNPFYNKLIDNYSKIQEQPILKQNSNSKKNSIISNSDRQEQQLQNLKQDLSFQQKIHQQQQNISQGIKGQQQQLQKKHKIEKQINPFQKKEIVEQFNTTTYINNKTTIQFLKQQQQKIQEQKKNIDCLKWRENQRIQLTTKALNDFQSYATAQLLSYYKLNQEAISELDTNYYVNGQKSTHKSANQNDVIEFTEQNLCSIIRGLMIKNSLTKETIENFKKASFQKQNLKYQPLPLEKNLKQICIEQEKINLQKIKKSSTIINNNQPQSQPVSELNSPLILQKNQSNQKQNDNQNNNNNPKITTKTQQLNNNQNRPTNTIKNLEKQQQVNQEKENYIQNQNQNQNTNTNTNPINNNLNINDTKNNNNNIANLHQKSKSMDNIINPKNLQFQNSQQNLTNQSIKQIVQQQKQYATQQLAIQTPEKFHQVKQQKIELKLTDRTQYESEQHKKQLEKIFQTFQNQTKKEFFSKTSSPTNFNFKSKGLFKSPSAVFQIKKKNFCLEDNLTLLHKNKNINNNNVKFGNIKNSNQSNNINNNINISLNESQKSQIYEEIQKNHNQKPQNQKNIFTVENKNLIQFSVNFCTTERGFWCNFKFFCTNYSAKKIITIFSWCKPKRKKFHFFY